MKKYKTWELLKMAEEREYGFNKSAGGKLKYRDSNGNIVVFDRNAWGKGLFLGNGFPLKLALVNTEWELVQQPVDFLTAVKAYSEGKTAECECEDMEKRIYEPKTYKTSTMKDQYGDNPSIKEMLEGKWYIRGGSNE